MSGFLGLGGLPGALLGTASVGGWMERFLRPASLRGRPFWIVAASDETTRRWVTHEFPGRDDPWHEDLGAGPEVIAVEGLLIGDDVTRQAAAMRAAARRPGTARLIHPWYGSLTVVVLGLQVDHSTTEARIARLRFKLQRAGTQPAPAIGLGLLSRVLDAVDDLSAQVSEAVAEFQAALAIPAAAASALAGLAGGLAGSLRFGLGGAGLAAEPATAAAIAALAGLGDGGTPVLAGARTAAVADAVAAAAEAQPATAPTALAALVTLAADPALVAVPADRSTPTLATAADAGAALAAGTRLALCGAACRVALATTWPSREEAIRDRDALAGALDGAAEAAAALGWDGAWSAATGLRATVIAEITERAAPLPRTRLLALAVPLPACLVAYALDPAAGTVFARGADIAARNGARHPGFLPAARDLEVIL